MGVPEPSVPSATFLSCPDKELMMAKQHDSARDPLRYLRFARWGALCLVACLYAARVAGAFLSAALKEIVQEWPRDGALLTIGVAPTSSVIDARFEARFPDAASAGRSPPAAEGPNRG